MKAFIYILKSFTEEKYTSLLGEKNYIKHYCSFFVQCVWVRDEVAYEVSKNTSTYTHVALVAKFKGCQGCQSICISVMILEQIAK